MKFKGQYMMLFSIIIAIFLLTYLLNQPVSFFSNSDNCINLTILSIAAHNVYANCSTLQLLLYQKIKGFGFLYCEKYNFTHIQCILQNCSSLLLNTSINNVTISTPTDYKIAYVPWNETCDISFTYANVTKRMQYACDEPAFIYGFEKGKLRYIG